MSDGPALRASSRSEIRDALGVDTFHALADMPWSFRVVARSGERVGVWVSEDPDTVRVTVIVENAAS